MPGRINKEEWGASTKKRFLVVFACAGCLGVICLAAACAGDGSEAATYEIVIEGEGNEITVNSGPDKTQFHVFSERGIGNALIEVTEGDFPDIVELLFHLNGLEELRFAYDSVEVMVSVSSSDDAVYQYVTLESAKEKPGRPIDEDSIYWMDIRIFEPDESADGASGSERLISVQLPDDFTSSGYRSFSSNWIDFFR